MAWGKEQGRSSANSSGASSGGVVHGGRISPGVGRKSVTDAEVGSMMDSVGCDGVTVLTASRIMDWKKRWSWPTMVGRPIMKSLPVSRTRKSAVTRWVRLVLSVKDRVRLTDWCMGTVVRASPRRT